MRFISIVTIGIVFLFLGVGCQPQGTNKNSGSATSNAKAGPSDGLSYWNGTETKERLVDFIDRVTTEGGADFVPEKCRIACFDMDGTVWCEKPFYFQFQFVVDRMNYLVDKHPEWKKDPLLKAVLTEDLDVVRDYGWEGLMEVAVLTHTGMTTDEYEKLVMDWIADTNHPKTGLSYNEMVYLPMIQMIHYLTEKKFKVFLVSAGGIDFLRPWADEVLGIPEERLIGSQIKLVYKETPKDTIIYRAKEILFVNDGPNKPVGIHRFIGKKPIIAFGNSDADIQMLDYCQSNTFPSMQVLIHHTDSVREYAYSAQSFVGQLNIGLRLAAEKNWLVVDMKNDWNKIFKEK